MYKPHARKLTAVFSAILLLLSLTLIVSAYTGNGDTIVYVTNTGSKYHVRSCGYLKSSSEICLEDAIIEGYTPCSRCAPPIYTGTAKPMEVRETTSYVANPQESHLEEDEAAVLLSVDNSTNKNNWQPDFFLYGRIVIVAFVVFLVVLIVLWFARKKGKCNDILFGSIMFWFIHLFAAPVLIVANSLIGLDAIRFDLIGKCMFCMPYGIGFSALAYNSITEGRSGARRALLVNCVFGIAATLAHLFILLFSPDIAIPVAMLSLGVSIWFTIQAIRGNV